VQTGQDPRAVDDQEGQRDQGETQRELAVRAAEEAHTREDREQRGDRRESEFKGFTERTREVGVGNGTAPVDGGEYNPLPRDDTAEGEGESQGREEVSDRHIPRTTQKF